MKVKRLICQNWLGCHHFRLEVCIHRTPHFVDDHTTSKYPVDCRAYPCPDSTREGWKNIYCMEIEIEENTHKSEATAE